MSEPTKEEALKYLRRWNVAWMLFVDHATPEETAKSEAVFHCLLDLVIKDWGMIEHGPEVSRECIEYLTKIEKRTQDIIEWLEEPWDDPNAVIDEMTIRLKRLLQDTRGRR